MANQVENKVEEKWVAFDPEEVNRIYHANGRKNLDNSIAYLKKYVYQLETEEYLIIKSEKFMTNPSDETFVIMKRTSFMNLYLNRFEKAIKTYMLNEDLRMYTVINHPSAIRINEKERKINLFGGFKFSNPRKMEEFKEETKNAVNKLIGYICDVLCSGDVKQRDYVLDWTANMCQGNKNSTAIVCRSPEGTGKSTFTEFLMNHVIGHSLSIESDSRPLTSDYNKLLFGKIFVPFEELSATLQQWYVMSAKLKTMITSQWLIFNEKFEKFLKALNWNNYWINTNFEVLKDGQGRRYIVLDVSTIYRNNHKFFHDLRQCIMNDEVGECFFRMMLDRKLEYVCPYDKSVKKWEGQACMPMTKSKQDIFEDRRPTLHKFFKQEYYLKDELKETKTIINGINVKVIINKTVDGLYEEYCCFVRDKLKDVKCDEIGEFVRKMRELHFNPYRCNGNINKYKITREELFKAASDNNFSHYLDKNFGNNSQSNKPKDETIFEMIKNESDDLLDKLIQKLQEEKAKRLSIKEKPKKEDSKKIKKIIKKDKKMTEERKIQNDKMDKSYNKIIKKINKVKQDDDSGMEEESDVDEDSDYDDDEEFLKMLD